MLLLAANSTTIMSRVLEVAHNHVMYDHGDLFPSGTKFVHFVLLAVSEEAKT